MVYQYDFVCTYKWMETPEEQEDLYRIQLLQAFALETWDEEQINNTIIDLFVKVYDNEDFKTILEKAQENASMMEAFKSFEIVQTADLVFTMLFEYLYFDVLHSCIADVLMHGAVHPLHLTNMLTALSQVV
jgi:hypothetical protein